MAKRQYSDIDKATALAALDANGGNVNRTANESGIPRKTLTEWANGRIHPEVADIRQEKRLELSELLDNEIRAIFEQMPKKRAEAFYSSLATVAAIFIDKKQLLDGKATNREEVITSLDDTTRTARIAALFDTARDRRDRQPNTPTDD